MRRHVALHPVATRRLDLYTRFFSFGGGSWFLAGFFFPLCVSPSFLCVPSHPNRFIDELPLPERDVTIGRPPLWVLMHIATGDGLSTVNEFALDIVTKFIVYWHAKRERKKKVVRSNLLFFHCWRGSAVSSSFVHVQSPHATCACVYVCGHTHRLPRTPSRLPFARQG